MKNVKKLHCGFVALMAVFALAFAGCAQSADDEDNAALENPTDANPDTDASGVEVLEAGDSVTVNVGESVTVKAEGKTAAEFTQSGLTITHKGDGVFEISADATMSDAGVSVNFNDGTDSDDGIDITVYVYDPNYTLNITLDSVVAESAASISIYAEGKEADETEAALKQTVNATYTAGAASASAKLAKDKANSYKYFNNIVVTVKDSDGNEIDVETNPVYFCYTDADFTGITVSEAVTSKTFTINFEGFTIPGGSVTGLKYSTAWANSSSEWADDTTVTPTVTVAADGASATFSVASTSEFYIDWTAVVIKDSSDNEIAISSGNTEGNKWYSYSGIEWSNTLSYVTLTDSDYTNALVTAVSLPSNTASGSVVLLKSDLSIPSDALAFKIVYTTGSNDIVTSDTSWITLCSDASWANETKLVNAWETGFDANATSFTVYITDSDTVDAFKNGNFYIAADSANYTGTITITYAK